MTASEALQFRIDELPDGEYDLESLPDYMTSYFAKHTPKLGNTYHIHHPPDLKVDTIYNVTYLGHEKYNVVGRSSLTRFG